MSIVAMATSAGVHGAEGRPEGLAEAVEDLAALLVRVGGLVAVTARWREPEGLEVTLWRVEEKGGVRAGGAARGEAPAGGGGAGPSREEVAARLAEEIEAASAAGRRWRPDYGRLMAETGKSRTWCERAAAEARRLAAERAVADSRANGSAGNGRVQREDLVGRLVEEIRAAREAGEAWRPDYGRLMAETGRGRRWCERVVQKARQAA